MNSSNDVCDGARGPRSRTAAEARAAVTDSMRELMLSTSVLMMMVMVMMLERQGKWPCEWRAGQLRRQWSDKKRKKKKQQKNELCSFRPIPESQTAARRRRGRSGVLGSHTLDCQPRCGVTGGHCPPGARCRRPPRRTVGGCGRNL